MRVKKEFNDPIPIEYHLLLKFSLPFFSSDIKKVNLIHLRVMLNVEQGAEDTARETRRRKYCRVWMRGERADVATSSS